MIAVNRLLSTEPTAVAEFVRTVLVGLVTAGWVVIPDTTINALVSAFALILSWVLAKTNRDAVTPNDKASG